MANVINSYEALYIINAQLSEEEIKGLVDKFTALVADNGTVDTVDEWGKRRLAYPINDIQEGYYVLVYFAADAEFPAELNRRFNIDDAIMRGMVIARESAKIPEAVKAPVVEEVVAETVVEAAPVVEAPTEA